MANQVPIVAILMIVQGALELIMGGFLVVMAFFFRTMFGMADDGFGKGPPPPDFQAVSTTILILYLAMGAAGVVAGVLHLVAGIRNLRYRGRTFGLVALVGGLASVGTCYCGPTTVGLTIYGLIVYLNAQTVRAFQLGEEGRTPEEIRRALALEERPPWEGPPPEHRRPEDRWPDLPPREDRPPEDRPPQEGIKPVDNP